MKNKNQDIIIKVISTTWGIWVDAKKNWEGKMRATDKTDTSELEYIKEKIDGVNKILASIDVILHGFMYELQKNDKNFNKKVFREKCGVTQLYHSDIYAEKSK